VRAPVRTATLWIRVVLRASARVIAGRMVVRRRARLDGPAPGGPRGHHRPNAWLRIGFTMFTAGAFENRPRQDVASNGRAGQ
jgi:hypothetical protein